MRRVWIYLFVTTVAVALVAIAQVFVFEFSLSARVYCDTSVPPDVAHIILRGTPCRLKPGMIASVYGPQLLSLLLFVQIPAYAYWIARFGSGSCQGPILQPGDPIYRRYVFKIGRWPRLLLEVYLYVTGLAVFFLAGFMASVNLSHNAGGAYCRYTKGLEPHNFYVQDEPCRLDFAELGSFIPLFLMALAVVHMPAYLYAAACYLRRYAKLRRRRMLRVT